MYFHLFVNLFIKNDRNYQLQTINQKLIVKQDFNIIIDNIEQEIIREQENLQQLQTVYIAVNCSRDLDFEQWKRILNILQPLASNIIEYNLELHCNDTDELFLLWNSYGVNRLIWKVISFSRAVFLQKNYCDNINYANQINKALTNGFKNQAIDLFFNLKGYSKCVIQNDLNILRKLPVDHISYYEDDNNCVVITYQWLKNILKENGYLPYEKNNFITNKGIKSQHQYSYWTLQNYLGVGMGSSSFHKNSQIVIFQNTNEYPLWRQTITKITKQEYYAQIFIMGLGLLEGVNLRAKQNKVAYKYFKNEINKLITKKKLNIKNNFLFCDQDKWENLDDILLSFI
ncbi:hypothetical protein [Spiroplasma endosymbiont of Asaphidion curtum]|uniref:hypothetical protein n=1 Tax=Spiroplasma endosymbiont of Asaphidion curtum TaxID=3066281 RepID=UPI00313DDDD4